MEKLLLTFAALSSLAHICSGIQCHQCAMVGGDTCGDYYDGAANADNIGDCGDKDTHCNKYKTVVKIGDSGYINGLRRESVIVTRGCERAEGFGDGCEAVSTDGGMLIKCRCSSDGCNSGRPLHSTTTLMTTIFISTAIWLFTRQ